MRNALLIGAAAASLVLAARTTAHAQPYSNAVMALNPVAYWPLSETAPPPFGAYIATNLGTAGTGGNGFYQTWFQCYAVGTSNLYYQTNAIVHVAGAIGDGDTALSCTRSAADAGQYVLFPRASGGVPNPVLTLQPPFSIEFWVNPAGTVSAVMPIVNEGRMPVLDPRNGYTTANWAGFSVGQYAGIAFFATYNGTGGDSTKQELDVPITAGTWHHARGRLLVLLLCGPILQCLTALDEVCGGICCRRRLCGYASASTWNLPNGMGSSGLLVSPKAEPEHSADGSQPVSSVANRASVAAGSHR